MDHQGRQRYPSSLNFFADDDDDDDDHPPPPLP
jgi:hypothetical protein